jgi:hypothetical protein
MAERNLETLIRERQARYGANDESVIWATALNNRVTLESDGSLNLDIQQSFESMVGMLFLKHLSMEHFVSIESVWRELYDSISCMPGQRDYDEFFRVDDSLGSRRIELRDMLEKTVVEILKAGLKQ